MPDVLAGDPRCTCPLSHRRNLKGERIRIWTDEKCPIHGAGWSVMRPPAPTGDSRR